MYRDDCLNLISYNAVIDRTLPIEGMKVDDIVLEDEEEDEE